MKRNLHAVLFLLLLSISNSYSQNYIREYTYKASDADSKLSSRTVALDQIKIILLQEIGTHIQQSIKITKDGYGNTFAHEDVEAITAGLTNLEILDEKWNGQTYYLKAKIEADTNLILATLKKYNKNTEESIQQVEALKSNKKKLDAARKEIIQLRKMLDTVSNGVKKDKISAKYAMQVDQMSLSDTLNKSFYHYQHNQFTDAAMWSEKAAEQGDSIGQNNLGYLYKYGKGVKQDYDKALDMFIKSEKQDNNFAQYNLATMYYSGKGVIQNYKQAISLFRKAAEGGNVVSQYNIGFMYSNGQGVIKDYTETAKWYRKAAEQGNANSQNNLGTMYYLGQGVKQDKKQALWWIRKAADQGQKNAIKNLKIL